MYDIKIVREDSLYNKYIKWFVYGKAENGATFTMGYKTLNEAREKNCQHRLVEIKTKKSTYKRTV